MAETGTVKFSGVHGGSNEGIHENLRQRFSALPKHSCTNNLASSEDQPRSYTYIPHPTPKETRALTLSRNTPSSILDEVSYLELKVLPTALKCVEKLLYKIKIGEEVDDPISFIAAVSSFYS